MSSNTASGRAVALSLRQVIQIIGPIPLTALRPATAGMTGLLKPHVNAQQINWRVRGIGMVLPSQ